MNANNHGQSIKISAARRLCGLIFLCALFAADTFAQDNFEFLAELISRGTVEQKRDALLQIRNLQTAEASRLAIPPLRDSSEIVRATAAFSVIFLPQNEAFDVLSPLLTDKNEFVRREAIYALGKVQNPLAVRLLLQIYQKDKILEVRNAAIIALGEIGDASAIGALTGILKQKPTEKNEFTRSSAARSIGQIAQIIQTGDAEVITPENFLPDRFKVIETPKYKNLPEQFPVFRATVPTLLKVLQNDKESAAAKRQAAFALGAVGDAAAIPILQANVNSTDYYLAEICRQSLRKIEFYQNLPTAE